jgi:uncharacterized protein (TIGR04255 family)
VPTADRPFSDYPLETIPLSPPPLTRVLSQVRFSPVFAVAEEAFVGKFQQSLLKRFPVPSTEMEVTITFVPSGGAPPAMTPTRIWRFTAEDGLSRVTLASTFVAYESSNYTTNKPYFEDLRIVLDATLKHVQPLHVERAGVRYTQRLTDDSDLANLANYFRPEILGAAAFSDQDAQLDVCLTQSQFSREDFQLAARWGTLPPHVSFDPGMPALDTRSWVFDLDVYDQTRRDFDTDTLANRLFDFSRVQYRFFRWSVEPAFLVRFGADPAIVANLAEGVTRK